VTLQPWQLLDSRYVIQDRWMSLRADRCQLPSGVLVDPYYVQESPDWVQVVAFDAHDRILTTRQYRHAARLICTEIPCGTIEAGELPQDSMRRELLEETGCAVESLRLLATLHPNPTRDSNRMHAFMALGTRQVEGQQLDATEAIEYEFLTISQVLSLIDSGGFPQALHIASLYLALRSRGMLAGAGVTGSPAAIDSLRTG
jgi:ADP-ribose pyrophosphatase